MDPVSILYASGVAACIMALGLVIYPVLQAFGIVHCACEDKAGKNCSTAKEKNTRRPA